MPWILKETESTQTYLKAILSKSDDCPHLDYVIADLQTLGKGRQGRDWVSSTGNLFISVWIKNHELPVTFIPLWISCTLKSVLQSYGVAPEKIKIKWPNDVLIDDRKKISGILCEKLKSGVLVGIGVNLISSPKILERETISLNDLVPDLEKEGLNLDFKNRLLKELRLEPSLSSLKSDYKLASLINQNDPLSWEDSHTKEKESGIFLRYGDHGEMVVSVEGLEKKLFSEEVHFIKRP